MASRLLMTHATGLGPLPELLEARGGSRAVPRAFRAENLPLQLVTDRTHRIPLVSMVGVFEQAARLSGDPLFGLEVGLAMAPGDYGRWVAFALQADTLGGALSRLSRCLVLHQLGGRLILRSLGNGDLLWGYTQSAVRGTDAMHHGDHVIPPMIRAVQTYCGSTWRPSRIVAAFPDPGNAARRAEALQAPWQFGGAVSGIVLPAQALWARRPARQRDTGAALLSSADVLAEIRQRRCETTVDHVSAIVALRLLDGQTDIDGAAAMAGLGRRSLQRHLDQAGLSYRAVLERVRMDRAKALIAETDATLSEIAEEVGYSDPAHFSRAFRRHVGVPPSHLRAGMLEQAT